MSWSLVNLVLEEEPPVASYDAAGGFCFEREMHVLIKMGGKL